MNNLKSLDDNLKTVKELIKKLISQPRCDRRTLPQKQGVYLIYNENEQIIYVGKSINLNHRINKNHISGAMTVKKSAFRKQLVEKKNLVAGQELKEWILANCSFSYIEIDSYDLCDTVESLMILNLRSNGIDLLNHSVE